MHGSATTEIVRIMGVWARRVDGGLARSAARNAAVSVSADRTRKIDDARTLRDLQKIPTAASTSRRQQHASI